MMKLTLSNDLSQQLSHQNTLRSSAPAKLPAQVQGADLETSEKTSSIKSVSFSQRGDGASVISKVDGATVLQGDYLNVTLPDSARNTKLLAMLAQLDEEGLKALVDSELLDDDEFLTMAEKLEPEQLQQFADIAKGLKANQFSDTNIGKQFIYQIEVKQLADKLQKLEQSTLLNVLDKGAKFSSAVTANVQDTESTVYDKQGALDTFVDPNNRDFRNFISAVVKMEKPEALMQTLSEFSEQQGKNLLALYAKDPHQAGDVVNALKDKSEAVKDAFTDQFAKLTRGAYLDQSGHVGQSSKGAESSFAMPFNAADLHLQVPKMIDQTLSLIQGYDFSDDQLLEMHHSLQGSVAQQQNYLDITETGLELLIGESNETKVSLEGEEESLLAIKAIQQSYAANALVKESKYTQQYISEIDRSITIEKSPFEAASDSQKVIETLVALAYQQVKQLTDSGANISSVSIADISSRTDALASKVLTLDADQRDSLVNDLASRLGDQGPLGHRNSELFAASLEDFNNRTAAIINSSDIEMLLTAQDKAQDIPESDFWRAASGVKEQVDTFSKFIILSENQQQKAIVTQVIDALDTQEHDKQDEKKWSFEGFIGDNDS